MMRSSLASVLLPLFFSPRRSSSLLSFHVSHNRLSASTSTKVSLLTAAAVAVASANDDEHYDVVIVGAGWAGLGAANELREHGIRDVLILEAKDDVGGRSSTSFRFGADVPTEMGSYYVPGTRNNPAYDAALRATPRPPMIRQEWRPALYDRNGRRRDRRSFTEAFNAYWYDFYEGYQRRRQRDAERDVPLGDVMDDYARSFREFVDRPSFDAFRWFYVAGDYSASFDDMSLWWWDSDEDFEGDYHFLGAPGGFRTLVDSYARPVRSWVRTGARVVRVDREATPPEVTYVDAQGTERRVRAERVLSTIPIGVLQAGTVEFRPPLEADRLSRLDKIGAGKALVVALRWRADDLPRGRPFWDETSHFFLLESDPNSEQEAGTFTVWVNNSVFNGGVPVLTTTLYGDRCDRYANAADADVVADAVTALRSRFGRANVPFPSDHEVRNWATDPDVRGAYSYARVGYDRDDRRRAGAPTADGRLFFAGEFLDETHPGSVNGALRSGSQVGREIAELVERSTRSPTATPVDEDDASTTTKKKNDDDGGGRTRPLRPRDRKGRRRRRRRTY